MTPGEHELETDALAELQTLRQEGGTVAKFRRHKASAPNPLAARKKAKSAQVAPPAPSKLKKIRRPSKKPATGE